MFRMSWLSARLALALFAVPVAGCSGGQTGTAETKTTGPSIKGQWQWCGTPTQAWDQATPLKAVPKPDTKPSNKKAKKPKKPECPTEIRRDFEAWEANADRSEMHKQQASPLICCYDRGAKAIAPPPPDAGPPDARPYIRRRPVKGRPLLIGESITLASVVEGDAWPTAELATERRGVDVSVEARAEIGRRWLDAALAEHASIASFARSAIELLAVGAPPDLVRRAQQSSIDEIEHARMCFAVASTYADRTLSAGPLQPAPPRELDLIGLAVTTFEEGCVCETMAAMEAAALVPLATDPAIRRVLEQIRDEEARHAELAWATVGWAARTGGMAVQRALRDAAQQLRPVATQVPASPFDQLLPAHGIMPAADNHELALQAWTDVITPLLDRLGDAVEHDTHAQLS